VVGTDLSAIQPPEVPAPNCEFVKEDSEEDWVYPNVPGFDYVHLRFTFSCFDDPKKVMKNAYENMNPDGWIEYYDNTTVIRSMDDEANFSSACWRHSRASRLLLTCSTETSMGQYTDIALKGAATRGRDLQVARHYARWMRELGCKSSDEVSREKSWIKKHTDFDHAQSWTLQRKSFYAL
jgi:hypothetical protein